MATKLGGIKTGGGRAPDSKRVTFDRGIARSAGGSVPIKTAQKE